MRSIVVGLISLLVSVHVISAEELGVAVPDFTLKSSEGTNVSASELRDRVVLLNFWATWCRPCIEEMPLLNVLQDQYSAAGFTVLGINVEDTSEGGTLSEVNAFIRDKKITFPILYDPQKVVVNAIEKQVVGKRMGLPTTVFIDKSGNARYLHEGYMPGDERDYRRLIELLIQE